MLAFPRCSLHLPQPAEARVNHSCVGSAFRGSAEQAVIRDEQSSLCGTKEPCQHFHRLGTREFLGAEPALTESLAAAPLLCGLEFVGVCSMVQKAGQLF